MDLFLAITQGIGTSLAAGARAAASALVVGLLAVANAGVDFEGTDYSFLESTWWLVLMAALVVGALVAARSGVTVPPPLAVAVATAVGAVLFAGALAEGDHASGPGIAAGAACALLAFAAVTPLVTGAQARLRSRGEGEAASSVIAVADLSAAALAGMSVLAPPVSVLALAVAAWALVSQRRRSQRKYEGLRILR